MLSPDLHNLMVLYFKLKGVRFDAKDPVQQEILKRSLRDAKAVLRMAGGDTHLVYQKVESVALWADEKGLDWNLGTVVKRWLSDNSTAPKRVYKEFKEEPEPDRSRISQGLQNIKDIIKRIKP